MTFTCRASHESCGLGDSFLFQGRSGLLGCDWRKSWQKRMWYIQGATCHRGLRTFIPLIRYGCVQQSTSDNMFTDLSSMPDLNFTEILQETVYSEERTTQTLRKLLHLSEILSFFVVSPETSSKFHISWTFFYLFLKRLLSNSIMTLLWLFSFFSMALTLCCRSQMGVGYWMLDNHRESGLNMKMSYVILNILHSTK